MSIRNKEKVREIFYKEMDNRKVLRRRVERAGGMDINGIRMCSRVYRKNRK